MTKRGTAATHSKITTTAPGHNRALQTDPVRYRCPEQLPTGAVLIVGSGASGCQIADELLRAGRTVYLSVSRHRRVPRRFWGRDVYWWLEKMGRFAQTIDSFPRRRWPPSIVVTGVNGGYDHRPKLCGHSPPFRPGTSRLASPRPEPATRIPRRDSVSH